MLKLPNVVAGMDVVEEIERRTAGLLGKAGSLRKMANNAMRYRSNRGNLSFFQTRCFHLYFSMYLLISKIFLHKCFHLTSETELRCNFGCHF